jgi:hypothetical protein
MKIYFNPTGVIPAIAGCAMLLYSLIMQLRGEQLVFFGNSEFSSLMIPAGGIGLILSAFRPANRKLPKSMLNPRPEKWPTPIERSFDGLKQVMNKAALESSARGVQDWQPVSEDREKGLLLYKRVVQERYDELTNPAILSGEMLLSVQLTEIDSKTNVTMEYQVLSPFAFYTVMRVVIQTKKRIDQARTTC